MNSLIKELIQPLLEELGQTVALYPGKFKPPHAGHFEVAKQLVDKADKVIVVISPKQMDNITASQSKTVWELYKTLLGNKLEIVIAENSPVKYVLDYIENHPNDKFLAAFGKGEFDRYKVLVDKPNITIVDGGTKTVEGRNLNASDFRIALNTNQNITQFLPAGIDYQDFIKALSYSKLEEGCGCQQAQPTDFKSALASLTKYMLNNGMNITPLPKLKIINNDSQNASNILGKTAYYNPENCSITLFTLGRHPKDILRSYAHEMIHRIQDNEGRLNNIHTTNTNEGGELDQLEREAYEHGNMCFRNWEDSIKNV